MSFATLNVRTACIIPMDFVAEIEGWASEGPWAWRIAEQTQVRAVVDAHMALFRKDCESRSNAKIKIEYEVYVSCCCVRRLSLCRCDDGHSRYEISAPDPLSIAPAKLINWAMLRYLWLPFGMRSTGS